MFMSSSAPASLAACSARSPATAEAMTRRPWRCQEHRHGRAGVALARAGRAGNGDEPRASRRQPDRGRLALI